MGYIGFHKKAPTELFISLQIYLLLFPIPLTTKNSIFHQNPSGILSQLDGTRKRKPTNPLLLAARERAKSPCASYQPTQMNSGRYNNFRSVPETCCSPLDKTQNRSTVALRPTTTPEWISPHWQFDIHAPVAKIPSTFTIPPNKFVEQHKMIVLHNKSFCIICW